MEASESWAQEWLRHVLRATVATAAAARAASHTTWRPRVSCCRLPPPPSAPPQPRPPHPSHCRRRHHRLADYKRGPAPPPAAPRRSADGPHQLSVARRDPSPTRTGPGQGAERVRGARAAPSRTRSLAARHQGLTNTVAVHSPHRGRTVALSPPMWLTGSKNWLWRLTGWPHHHHPALPVVAGCLVVVAVVGVVVAVTAVVVVLDLFLT